jgi:uncharacterized protein
MKPKSGSIFSNWKNRNHKSIKYSLRIFSLLIVSYLIIVTFVYFFQSKLIYHPIKSLKYTPHDIGVEYKDIYLKTADGVKIHGWFLSYAKSKKAILFAHGNGGNISHRLSSLNILHNLGFNILIFDYRGYGKSEGSPSESGTYKDVRAAWDYLVTIFPPENIVLFGRSLGGAVITNLATTLPKNIKPKGIILESTFTSIPDLASIIYWYLPVRMLSRFNYNTLSLINKITIPILITHSYEDELIPFSHGKKLYKTALGEKFFLSIKGNHNEGFVDSGSLYRNGLKKFLSRLFPGKRKSPSMRTPDNQLTN